MDETTIILPPETTTLVQVTTTTVARITTTVLSRTVAAVTTAVTTITSAVSSSIAKTTAITTSATSTATSSASKGSNSNSAPLLLGLLVAGGAVLAAAIAIFIFRKVGTRPSDSFKNRLRQSFTPSARRDNTVGQKNNSDPAVAKAFDDKSTELGQSIVSGQNQLYATYEFDNSEAQDGGIPLQTYSSQQVPENSQYSQEYLQSGHSNPNFGRGSPSHSQEYLQAGQGMPSRHSPINSQDYNYDSGNYALPPRPAHEEYENSGAHPNGSAVSYSGNQPYY